MGAQALGSRRGRGGAVQASPHPLDLAVTRFLMVLGCGVAAGWAGGGQLVVPGVARRWQACPLPSPAPPPLGLWGSPCLGAWSPTPMSLGLWHHPMPPDKARLAHDGPPGLLPGGAGMGRGPLGRAGLKAFAPGGGLAAWLKAMGITCLEMTSWGDLRGSETTGHHHQMAQSPAAAAVTGRA